MMRPRWLARRHSLLLALMALPVAAEEARVIVSVHADEHQPTWLGLIDLAAPPQADTRVRHLPITARPQSAMLNAGSYRLDHIDFSQTIAGDERTVRVTGGPVLELEPGSLSYFGDLHLEAGEIRFIVSWDTIDAICASGIVGDSTLNIMAPGTARRKVVDACNTVNLGNN